jgi:hypothetical protein
MNAGDTFLIPALDDHLWIVLSDPAIDRVNVVLVCLLSWQPHHDQACILEPGDHPFVKHSTCVHYPWARTVTDARLEELKRDGKLRLRPPLLADVLDRVRTSAASGDIPTECYDILRRQGFVP